MTHVTGEKLATAQSVADYVHWFRHAAPYIHEHRGKVFVVVFSGEAVQHAQFSHIIHDIALLKSLGVKLVLVHGARTQVEQNLAAQGIVTPIHNHLRITTAESLRCVLDAVGSTRIEIEARLSMGLANSPMHGARLDTVSGNFIVAKPFGVRDGVDFEYTGAVRSVDTSAITSCLNCGQIVLLGPIGYSATGEVFNLLAEQVAVKTAISLKADKLIFMGAEVSLPPALNATQSTTAQSASAQANTKAACKTKPELVSPQALAAAQQTGVGVELKRHLTGSAKACAQGVTRAHIISYLEDGALLKELYTREGAGILVANNSFEDIYAASVADIGGLLELLAPLEDKGVLVRRSRKMLENDIEHFSVIKRDDGTGATGVIVGCAAFYVYEDVAEIASIAIHPEYRNTGRGEKLLTYLEVKAKAMGLNKIFVLTTQTAHWFLEQGFVEGGLDDLPATKQQSYNTSRASKIYIKYVY